MRIVKMTNILFDLDDTLVATRETIFSRFSMCGNILGIDLTNHDMEFLYSLMGSKNRADKLEQLPYDCSNFWQIYDTVKSSIPHRQIGDTRELLNELRINNSIGIVTDGYREAALRKLKILELSTTDLTIFQTRDECEFSKPDNRVFEKSKGILGRNCTYIGDNLVDFIAARDASLEFLGVLTGKTTSREFTNEGLSYERVFEDVHTACRQFYD